MLTVVTAILAASLAHDLPRGLLSAVCYVESNHRPAVTNLDDGGSPSYGLCQVKEDTARMLGYQGTAEQLRLNPYINAKYAAKYLRKQIDRYDGDLEKGVAAYNAGRLKLNAKGDPINARYVRKVFDAWSAGR